MLQPRLIPVLLVDQHLHLVKTTRFCDRHYLGDPLNAAYVFSGYEVDELMVLDIDASASGRVARWRGQRGRRAARRGRGTVGAPRP